MRVKNLILFLFALRVIVAGDFCTGDPINRSEDMVVLKPRRTSDHKDVVEMSCGDMTILATELSFVHDNGTRTTVRCRDGAIECQNWNTTLTGKEIFCAPQGGPLGKTGGLSRLLRDRINHRNP